MARVPFTLLSTLEITINSDDTISFISGKNMHTRITSSTITKSSPSCFSLNARHILQATEIYSYFQYKLRPYRVFRIPLRLSSYISLFLDLGLPGYVSALAKRCMHTTVLLRR